MLLKKNIKVGKVNFLFIAIFYLLLINDIFADTVTKSETIAELSILDKVSSKNTRIQVQIGKEFSFQNLSIKVLKCKNSKFDDNPEITSYLQVRDLNNVDNNEVFVFNGWTFSSSPSIQSFDHPVYDLWILKCY